MFQEAAVLPVSPGLSRIYTEYFEAQHFAEYVANLVNNKKFDELQALYTLFARYRAYNYY